MKNQICWRRGLKNLWEVKILLDIGYYSKNARRSTLAFSIFQFFNFTIFSNHFGEVGTPYCRQRIPHYTDVTAIHVSPLLIMRISVQ